MQVTNNQGRQSTAYRTVASAFGTLFVACAIAIVIVSELLVGVGISIAVIAGLGMDAIICGLRAKRSLLARIGPLP